MSEQITPTQFRESEGTADWRVLSDGACAYYPTTSFAQASSFVGAIAAIPGDRYPDIDVRPDGVTLRLLTTSAEWYGMSRDDVELAGSISAVASELGLTADPSKVQSMLVVPGAPDIAAIMPFWQAVLGYDRRPDSPDEDLVDPRNRNAAFWFEQMRQPSSDGGGAIHVGVWLPSEYAEARVAAALAAGGRMVRDDFAPSWWTLADAAGNEADIGSIAGRD